MEAYGSNNNLWGVSIKKLLWISWIVVLVFTLSSCNTTPKSDEQKVTTPPKSDEQKATTPVDDLNQSGVVVEDSVISWANMEVDDQELNLTDEQKAILQYFDKDYLWLVEYDNLQKYPKAFRNAQIRIPVIIEKIISANDDTFECVASMPDRSDFSLLDMEDTNGSMLNEYITLEGKNLLYLTGKQGEARLTAGESLYVYGRYLDVQEHEIDEITYQFPNVSVNYTQNAGLIDFLGEMDSVDDLFSASFGETVAKALFGNNIKLKKVKLYADPADNMLLITPDNQSNANFAHICIDLTKPWIIPITTATDFNEEVLEGQTYVSPWGESEEQRKLNMSSDFEHYILSVYNTSLKKFYLEWYDRDFKKIWSREFDNVEQVPYDYTKNEIYLVADNDLYIIDTATGDDKITPTMVGEKALVNISTDGTYLIGMGNKDNVMKVNAEGQILWKTSVDTYVDDYEYGLMMQIVNGNVVARLNLDNIAVIDPEGNVLLSFEDGFNHDKEEYYEDDYNYDQNDEYYEDIE